MVRVPRAAALTRAAGKKVTASLSQRLPSKKGHFRRRVMGKVVQFCARAPIVGCASIAHDEVGVPLSVALALSYPLLVCAANIIDVKVRMVSILPGSERRAGLVAPETPRWNALQCGGRMYLRETLKKKQIQAIANRIKPGDILYRCLEDGDCVVMNRQPTLSKSSIMAHRVRILPGSCFRLHPNMTTPYSGDFDGDEMNLHAPQTVEAVAEMAAVMAVKDNADFHFIQNTLLASWQMATDVFSLNEATLLMGSVMSPRWVRQPVYSGRDILAFVLPFDIPATLGKEQLGAGGALMRRILAHPERMRLADDLNAVLCQYCQLRGFSVGISDCVLPNCKPVDVSLGVGPTTRDRIRHLKALNLLATERAVPFGNAFKAMADAGSKGSLGHLMQIACAVTDRFVDSKAATLAGNGYCANNYLHGLSWREFVFDLMQGRAQLTASKNSPAESGDLNRKLCHFMQNLVVNYANEVVDESGRVIQTLEPTVVLEDNTIIRPWWGGDYGTPIGLQTVHEVVSRVTQSLLDSKHRVGLQESSRNRLFELLTASAKGVHDITVEFDTAEEQDAFCEAVATPQVISHTIIKPEDLECKWVRNWVEAFGPLRPLQGAHKVVFAPESLGTSMREHCRGLDALHSHEVYHGKAEMIVYGGCAQIKPGPVLAVRKQGLRTTIKVRKPFLHRVFAMQMGRVVDATDIHDVRNTMGLEAARASLFRQLCAESALQGVNPRRISLIVDYMCSQGRVVGATAKGIEQQTMSTWSRACFNNPLQHILRAAVSKKQDLSRHVSAAILTNTDMPFGTSFPAFELLPHEEKEEEEEWAAAFGL